MEGSEQKAPAVNSQLVAIATLCLGLGAAVQATLGFGMGLVAIPLLVWGGFSLPQAIGVLIPNVLVQTAFGCWRFRRELPWSDVGPISVVRLLALPIGVLLLGLVAEQGQAMTRGVLGAGLLGALLFQPPRPTASRPPPGRLATLAAGSASGLLAGLIGMGGPPLVVWVMRHDWDSVRQRCFLWLSILLVMPVQILLMSLRFGRVWLGAVQIGCCVVPLTVLIAWQAGIWADRWSKQRLRFAMRLFLLLIAVRLVLQVGWPWARFWNA